MTIYFLKIHLETYFKETRKTAKSYPCLMILKLENKGKYMKKYDNFFDEIVKLKEKQEQQKMRGLNDYNLLTTVLNPSDEVKLHSRMIASFLNIYGSHYQNSLFLELFLDSLKLENFDIDLNSAWVNNEYANIDIAKAF